MGEIKHTPGPWAVTGISMDTGNISVGSKAQRIVIADVTNAASFGDMLSGAMRRGGGGFSQDDCTTQHANARLIAAAPDLLADVRRDLAFAKEVVRFLTISGETKDVLFTHAEQRAAALTSAIAKAEGRS